MASLDGLSIDLLQLIAEKIDNHRDVLRFGSVCREFCSIIMDNLHLLPPKLPLCLCVHPSKPIPLPLLMQCRDNQWERINFFSISDGRNHGEFIVPEIRNRWIVGSSYGWLLTVDIQGRDIQLLNPLTRAQITLPSLDAFQHPNGGFTNAEYNDFGFVEKAVIFSDPSSKRRNLNDDADCILAMAIISNFHVLSFCRVGDDKWTNVKDSLTHLQDVICYKGQIYGVNYEGIAVVCDIAGDTEMKQIANAPDELFSVHRYLVESTNGDLLHVVREIDYGEGEDVDFYIYKLEPVDKPVKPTEDNAYLTLNELVLVRYEFNFEWVEMDSLGDQALFLGQNYSRCVRAAEYEGCKPNCIYFTEHGLGHRCIARGHCKPEDFDELSTCDMGIYNFEDKSYQDFSQVNVKCLVPPTWILPNPW